ncbi:MAG TPA: hypothetical protein VJK51_02655 [Candidatus Nanoarchaeia archaeon]|nr:hypothetical protein [Candidatus Nanoarchaeia archaeon]
MVVKKKVSKVKKSKKLEEEHEGGASMEDAFAGDEDVEYAPSKARKVKGMSDDELEDELDGIQATMDSHEQKEIVVKASKPVGNLKKGDHIRLDGKEMIVDAHDVLIDHGSTKEMAVDFYDPITEQDFQLRYFSDQITTSLEVYELQEIMYVKKRVTKIEW